MKASAISIAVLLLLAVRPARAADVMQEEPSVTDLTSPPLGSQPPQPLAVPVSAPAPPGEGRLTAAQILLGTLATLGVGSTTTLIFGELGALPLVYLGLAAAPAIGGEAVCAVGRWSRSYDGSCAPAVIGGYLGAIVLGAGLGLYFVSTRVLEFEDDGGTNDEINFVAGAFVGGIVGTAIGATIGWHLDKHLRDAGVTVSLSTPPLPPPAAMAEWPELRARAIAAPTGLAVNLPLLAVRF